MKIHSRINKLCLMILLFASFWFMSGARAKEQREIDPAVKAEIAAKPTIIHEKLVSSMNKLLNNPATLTIELTPYDDERTTLGQFEKIVVVTSNGKVDGLMLHQADIEFEDVELDTTKLIRHEEIDPISMKNINMDVTITQDDLNSFLEDKSRSIKVNNPRVEMSPGKIELSGSARYGLIKARFWASGDFSIAEEREIWFHARRMRLNHMSMPRSFIGSIVKRINPVLNLEQFPFKLNLSEILIEEGKMIFTSSRKGEN